MTPTSLAAAKSVALLLLAASTIPQRLPAADWPQFRGPFGNGVSEETNLPEKIDAVFPKAS